MAFLERVGGPHLGRHGLEGFAGQVLAVVVDDRRCHGHEMQPLFGRGQLRQALFEMCVDEARGQSAFAESRVGQDGIGKIHVGGKPLDVVAVQRPHQGVDRGLPCFTPGDDLGEQRVIEDADEAAGFDAAVETDVRRRGPENTG